MEVEQMRARLLEEMRTNQAKAKANQEEIKATTDSHHEKLITKDTGRVGGLLRKHGRLFGG
jgi:hypothetical protein